MLQFVDEAEALVRNENCPLREFGQLLHEGWKIKRGLTQKISNSAIDEIYEAGLSAGATGGKLLGAGGGGFMLFFIPPEHRRSLRIRLKKLLCVPFSFSTRGSDVIVYEPEEQYDQALAMEREFIYAQNGA
jgi:D-glycero-alpha-D-manno-heptose-7-phosphate kinase